MSNELNDFYLGFIGAGNMALALVQGYIKSGQIRPNQISVSAPTDRNLIKFKELGCAATNHNNHLFGQLSESKQIYLFICVKPNVFRSKLSLNLTKLISNRAITVISVMAGITLNELKEKFSSFEGYVNNLEFVRLMPNTATTVCAGICGIAFEEKGDITPEEGVPQNAVISGDEYLKKSLTKLFSPIGLCEFVAENQMNAVCGMGGSGIAFVYSLIHAMSDGGLKMGLPRNVANNLAAQTVLGAALMTLNTGKNPIVLRDEVTSPGGTTIHGLHALEKGAFNSVIMDAIESATERANQLS